MSLAMHHIRPLPGRSECVFRDVDRAHGILRLVCTDRDQNCPAMALAASVVKPHSAGVLES